MLQKDVKTVWNNGNTGAQVLKKAEKNDVLKNLKKIIEQQQQIIKQQQNFIDKIEEKNTFKNVQIDQKHQSHPRQRKPSDNITCSGCLKSIGAICGCDPHDNCFCFVYKQNDWFTNTSACNMCGHTTPSQYKHICGKCYTYYHQNAEYQKFIKNNPDYSDDD